MIVSELGIKGAPWKGSVVSRQGWARFVHFVNGLRTTFHNEQLQAIAIHHLQFIISSTDSQIDHKRFRESGEFCTHNGPGHQKQH